MTQEISSKVPLARSLSLPYIIFYGFGTTVGAGIFVLVGKVAGVAGMQAPLSFLLAGVLAGLTACSFAEMSARFPESAGEAVYVFRGFGRVALARLVGGVVMISGVVSCATIIKGFVGYFQTFIAWPSEVIICAVAAFLTLIACWGIKQSVSVAVGVTCLTLVGLGVVIWAGAENLATVGTRWPELLPSWGGGDMMGIAAGAVLAFYAFIGFEDLVNVAEETQDVRRNMPRAILATLILTTLLYTVIILIAVLSLPRDVLAESGAPIALLYEQMSGRPAHWISVISMLAVIDGGLIQIVMASRIVYGLSKRGWLPAAIGAVSPLTQTPVRATVGLGLIICLLALFVPLVRLAEVTSLCLLLVFMMVNLSLLAVKRKQSSVRGIIHFPLWVPLLGVVACGGLATYQLVMYAGFLSQ
ncbi:MAG: amino acid permease [Kordiimonas sp.]|nr:amino acid permease [Kordiimonas sp.]